MKKKIMIFMLLVTVLVSMLVPVRASAADRVAPAVYYDEETHTFYDDYGNVFELTDEYAERFYNENYNVLVLTQLDDGPFWCVNVYYIEKKYDLCAWKSGNTFFHVMENGLLVSNDINPSVYYTSYWFYPYDETLSDSVAQFVYKGSYIADRGSEYTDMNGSEYFLMSYCVTLYCDIDIMSASYDGESVTPLPNEALFYEAKKDDGYTFKAWCSDAGLNCAASSNESDSVIPYSYNGYFHVVRKSSGGKWLLTTIGNSQNQTDMTLRFSEDEGSLMIYNAYSGEDVNGYLANVRQYEYDTDGWKLKTYETLDSREYDGALINLSAGSGVDSTRLLAFTNTDIYSFNGYAVMEEASTEYVEITDTITPSTAPEEDVIITKGYPVSGYINSDEPVDVYAQYRGSEILLSLESGAELVLTCAVSSNDVFWYGVQFTVDGVMYEGYILQDYVSVSQTITPPTPTPSGGSSSGGGRPGTSNRPSVEIGGDAEPGSGLDFIVTLYSMLWSRVFSIPMNVDGYSISMQQIVVYIALAVIVGGAVYLFLTGRKR